MDRINNFFLKNFNFNYFQFFKLRLVVINNSEFFNKKNKFKNLFFLKYLNLKKINLNKQCINIIYF